MLKKRTPKNIKLLKELEVEIGSRIALAKKLKVAYHTLSAWYSRQKIPVIHTFKLAKLSGRDAQEFLNG